MKMQQSFTILAICLAGILLSAPHPCRATPLAWPAIIQGVTVTIPNGNTLVIWKDHRTFQVSLYGIQAPGLDPPAGRKAKNRVSDLVFDKKLPIHLTNLPAKPVAGIIFIKEKNLNQVLVREGAARVDQKTCLKASWCQALKNAQATAKKKKTGIWHP
jgi:endonuclease YncB( thermonuclease family)